MQLAIRYGVKTLVTRSIPVFSGSLLSPFPGEYPFSINKTFIISNLIIIIIIIRVVAAAIVIVVVVIQVHLFVSYVIIGFRIHEI